MSDAAESLFRATFHGSPIGMAIMNEVGHYAEVNPAFGRILGYEPEEIVSRNFAEFTHPEDLARDVELLSQLARDQFPYYQTQKRYVRKDGSTVWVRVTVTRVDGDHTDELHHFIAQIEDITDARIARDNLEQQALYDPLTGLGNRALLMERLDATLKSHEKRNAQVALMFLDIDHFKLVNDSLGHEAGDHLLTMVAQRIQSSVRKGDTACRLGGDEFVVIFENVESEEQAEQLAELITRAAQTPVTLMDHEIVPTVSAGLVVAHAGSTPEEVLRDADTAMYSAKQSGRAKLKIYDLKLREQSSSRFEVEAELRKALREGDLAVHYQPVVDLLSLKIVAYEALVRWNHPERGLIMPGEFLAIAEQIKLVVPIGSLVMHEACGFIQRHPEFEGRMFVNISPKQIGTANLAGVVERALKSTGIDPSRLCVEITEAGILAATSVARDDVDSVGDLGVDLLIDDFGNAYAALSSMLHNRVSGIKLSAEYGKNLGDNALGDRISLAAANLTKTLGVMGVVEGVETMTQYTHARQHGWELGQGYLFGHPMPESEINFAIHKATIVADEKTHA